MTETFRQAVERCERELAADHKTTYRGREIEDSGLGLTHNGSDFFTTVREVLQFIDESGRY